MIKTRLKHKFNAKRCESDGIKFPSLLERSCYLRLKQMQEDKEILFFLRQVPFDLPGKSKHVIDYCIFTNDSVLFVEAKGRDLQMGKLKRNQVSEIYNIEIFVVKNAFELIELVQING